MIVSHPTASRTKSARLGAFNPHLLGVALLGMLMLDSQVTLGSWAFWQFGEYRAAFALTLLTSLFSLELLRRLNRIPGLSDIGMRILSVSLSFILAYFVLVILLLPTPVEFLVAFYLFFVSFLFFTGRFKAGLWQRNLRVGLITQGRIAVAKDLSFVNWVRLDQPVPTEVDAIAVDLHHAISPDWMRYLADSSLNNVPVYHIATVYENITGQISLRHLRDTVLTGAKPSRRYMTVKRILDLLFVFLTLPIILPIMGAAALLIFLESPGPVLFWQRRVGLKGDTFWMVKFRSMRKDAETSGAQFATQSDLRVTRVGRFIRRLRIDELPQLYNVLRGDMSWIGPRPEQVPFVREFERSIPFYSYRHMARPGITGWAQVRGGYAANSEETQNKLTYDLYYVKHLSLWLDLTVVMKTIRTVLTGFGAR